MKKYRVTVDDKRHSEITQVVVESDSVAEAIFQAGLLAGRDVRDEYLADLAFVKIEEPAGWIKVEVW